MARERTLSIKEIQEMINDEKFLASNDDDFDDTMIDIVELPPDTVDDLSDREDLDDNSMDDEIPTDVPGHVEIHHETREEEPKLGHAGPSTISVPEIIEPPPAKKRKLLMASSWRKKAPQYTKVYAKSDAVEAKKSHLIGELQGKTPVECFEKLLDDKIVTHICNNLSHMPGKKMITNFNCQMTAYTLITGLIKIFKYLCMRKKNFLKIM